MTKKKQDWVYDKKNLANNGLFNVFFWGFSLMATVVGTKHIGIYGLTFEAGLVAVIGILFLSLQFRTLLRKINVLENEKTTSSN